MPRQLQLFPMPAPTSREIRDLVRERLHGFPLRQWARDRRRREVNEYHRADRAIRNRKRKTEASRGASYRTR